MLVLRSEMQVASVSVRFGLILEAYCRGSQEHMRLLVRQIECLEKLKLTSDEMVRSRKDKEKAKQFLQERLTEPHCQDALSKVLSPLDPRYRCKRVRYVQEICNFSSCCSYYRVDVVCIAYCLFFFF